MRRSRKADYGYFRGYFKVIFIQAPVEHNYSPWLYGKKYSLKNQAKIEWSRDALIVVHHLVHV